MRYTIWHARNPTFQNYKVSDPQFPIGYEKVAEVDCISPEHVFQTTQHINASWQTNQEVVKLFKQQVRSTSVGDMVVDAAGKKFYCQMCGWFEIP